MDFDNIRLLVTRFDECFTFYHEKLGFSVSWGEKGGGYASFQTPNGHTIAIFSRAEMAEAVGADHLPATAEAQDRFALILRVKDLKATVARLKAEGIPILKDIEDRPSWGIRTAHLRDPDGNLIELVESLPREAWSDWLRQADENYRKQEQS